MIEIRDLTCVYSNGTVGLENVSAVFQPGQTSAVLGESGSGKTTLLKCMGRFLKPTKGSVALDGTSVYDMPHETFRRRVGIVFQKLNLFPHHTVLGNLTLALDHVARMAHDEAVDRARSMLSRMGIADIENSYPSQISGGQAQRVAIIRGLLLQPEYMLLDEPTSALDVNTTDGFADWLRQLSSETSFIIVTHDIDFAQKTASGGICMRGGRVTGSGTMDDIIAQARASQTEGTPS